MGTTQTLNRITVHEIGDVTVVKFKNSIIIDESLIQEINSELFALVDTEKRFSIVVSFCNVELASNTVLGVLINLKKKLETHSGQLTLCDISPEVYEVFTMLKLDQLFDIKRTEPEAIAAF